MDQIFDRLGTLLKSYLSGNQDAEDRPRGDGGYRSGGSGDADLNDAMDELDAFLKDDREGQERLERERRRRAEEAERESRERFSRSWGNGRGASNSGAGPSDELVGAYKTLGLSYGAPMSEVKSAYKRLLKLHHPDRHSASPEEQKKATATSARINEAYARIEAAATANKKSGHDPGF